MFGSVFCYDASDTSSVCQGILSLGHSPMLDSASVSLPLVRPP